MSPTILLTNDDGIYSPGLRALRRVLAELGTVTVVAPASEQSGVGHSITLVHPLVVQEVHDNGELIGFAVDGKPADCVKLGLVALLPEKPDLVVSGINTGANAGINVLYSGTVAAAIEGAFFDVVSIAVSLELAEDSHFERAARIAAGVIGRVMSQRPRAGELFNVNIPCLAAGDPLGIRVVPQAIVCYRERYEARIDPRGRRYYWLLPDALVPGQDAETDLGALAGRFVTVTPLHFDLTARHRLEAMRAWHWD